MMRVFIMSYDDVPPSLNTAHSRHWSYFHKTKRRWQGIFSDLLLASGLPRKQDCVRAEASMRFPVTRRRDEGNFRWMLEKALGDALVSGGWILDDQPDSFTTGALTFEAELGRKRTTLRLTVEGSKHEVRDGRSPCDPQ